MKVEDLQIGHSYLIKETRTGEIREMIVENIAEKTIKFKMENYESEWIEKEDFRKHETWFFIKISYSAKYKILDEIKKTF
jgi:hypothetical protein